MESNRARVLEVLARCRADTEVAIEVFRGGSAYMAPLEVVRRLTPDAMKMAMSVHVELVEQLAEFTTSCGYADVEIVAVVNGLKELMEQADGGWYYEEGEWHERTELQKQASRASMEVAK